MATIEWREEFETGNSAVDYEHHDMVDLLNELMETIDEGGPCDEALDFLGEVNARISAHFALEEAEMQRNNYDEFEGHKEDHEHLLDDIRDIMDAYESGDYANKTGAFSARLEVWFIQHFKTRDARLHKALSSH